MGRQEHGAGRARASRPAPRRRPRLPRPAVSTRSDRWRCVQPSSSPAKPTPSRPRRGDQDDLDLSLRHARLPPVADTPDRDQPDRHRGIGLDLLAQPAYVHGHRRLVAEGPPPHLLEQLVARERLAGMGDQEARGGRTRETSAAARRPRGSAACRSLSTTRSPSVTWPGGVLRPLTGPPQHRVHPQRELARAERLGDVVVGPPLQTDDAVGLGAERGQHDHRDVAASRAAAGRPRGRRSPAASGRGPRGRRGPPRIAFRAPLPSAASTTSWRCARR